jgi:hypothetical protein
MNPFIEDILNRIQDLLALSPPVSICPSKVFSPDIIKATKAIRQYICGL